MASARTAECIGVLPRVSRDALQAVDRLPKGGKVVVLADYGFVQTDCRRAISAEFGWHYRIRLKRDTWIWRAGKGGRQLKNFSLHRGEALCFHHIKLHKSQWFGPVHVASGQPRQW